MSCLWPGRGGAATDYISSRPCEEFCKKRPRTAVILGSTGSIGKNAVSVIEESGGFFRIEGLAGARNAELLARQAQRHRPPFLAVLDDSAASRLKIFLPKDYRPEILTGPQGYAFLASLDSADCVLSAQVGAAGLVGTLAAALAGKVIALANKESLVLAGSLLRAICQETHAAILPVDSEHYAIFQCLAERGQNVSGLVLTASGGPFRGRNISELRHVAAQDALKHPNWQMGAKISIDSATMMNKGLELIEAMHLYGVSADKVEIVIHPQSIVHSLARFLDNSMLAQLAVPDMRLPISSCLMWPECRNSFIRPLELAAIGSLTFSRPDDEVFPCPNLARKAASYAADAAWLKLGINPACIALNAANESAVEMFLAGRCGFLDIAPIIEAVMNRLVFDNAPPLPYPLPTRAGGNAGERALDLAQSIFQLDALSREKARAVAEEIG